MVLVLKNIKDIKKVQEKLAAGQSKKNFDAKNSAGH